METLAGAGAFSADGGAPDWVEHLRVADLSVGTYSLPAGSVDDQEPHTEDEIYVVLRGRGTLWTESAAAVVEAGSTLYVPAGEVHRFIDITEDLVALVVFAPAEGTRAP